MHRIILAVALAGVLPAQALDETPRLKDQLVGAWTLVACEGANAATQPWCAGPNGIQIWDASGHYAVILAARDRPKYDIKEPHRLNMSAEQIQSTVAGFVSNFGTWSINEETKKITHHIDGALYPNIVGQSYDVTIRGISGDELKLSGPLSMEIWRRIKR